MPSDIPVLPADTLASLRTLSDANLPHTATVTVARASGTRVGGALVTPVDDVVAVDLACRLLPLGTRMTDVLRADQLAAVGRWWLTFTAGTTFPTGAVAAVTGTHPDGTSWTKRVRLLIGQNTSVNEVMARYECVDVSPSGR